MPDSIVHTLKRFGFSEQGGTVLVAVSGGVDSMVLATALHKAGYALAVAHCNYQLRGVDSEADEALVKDWCVRKDIPFHVKRVNTAELAQASNASVQMVARNERYAFFDHLMRVNRYSVTALAHHANDRVETLLLNVLRGTGFRGFQGMPTYRPGYIRPMLHLTKEQILQMAQAQQVPYRDDASNLSVYYKRNWVRHRVLPMLEALDAHAFGKLLAFAERAETELPNYLEKMRVLINKLYSDDGISVQELRASSTPFTLVREMLSNKGFSSDQMAEVLKLLNAESGKEVCSGSHRVLRNRDRLLVLPLNKPVSIPGLKVERLDRTDVINLNCGPHEALIDADKVEEEQLKLRRWQQGDRFKPLGMKGSKLLSDLFIDAKLSQCQKEQVWLVTYQDRIVWVVGLRLDDRFKITGSTQQVLRLSVHS